MIGWVCVLCRRPFRRSKGQREANILNGQYDLARIAHLPDALDLVERMIQLDPAHRYAWHGAVGRKNGGHWD